MARPREFDTDVALDGAIAVFREHGFEGTSAQALVDAEIPRRRIVRALRRLRDELPEALLLSGVNFSYANLTRANLIGVDLDGVTMTGAYLYLTSLRGANLSRASGLMQAQIDLACGTAETKLPAGLKAPKDWPCSDAEAEGRARALARAPEPLRSLFERYLRAGDRGVGAPASAGGNPALAFAICPRQR